MEIIKNYLENMFMNLPRTPEVLKAKEELLAMMEDKYSELKALGHTENEAVGTVISEFGNLEELAETLGIASFMGGSPEQNEQSQNFRHVSLDEVKEYIAVNAKSVQRIGIGVVLCILSPLLLIFFGGISIISDYFFSSISSKSNLTLLMLGVPFLLIMIAVAVGLFINSGLALKRYSYLKYEPFQVDYRTMDYLKEQQAAFQPMFAAYITVGVILCIIGLIPLLVCGAIFRMSVPTVIGIMAFLVFVAFAVYLFIIAGGRMSCFKVVMQEKEYSVKHKTRNYQLIETIAGIYWPLVVCLYLGYSFITHKWGSSWIIWPIAGVLFGGIASLCEATRRDRR